MVYCVAAILATGFAPLPMEDNHEVHDFQFNFDDDNDMYDIVVLYNKEACCTANSWFSLNGEGDLLSEILTSYISQRRRLTMQIQTQIILV